MVKNLIVGAGFSGAHGRLRAGRGDGGKPPGCLWYPGGAAISQQRGFRQAHSGLFRHGGGAVRAPLHAGGRPEHHQRRHAGPGIIR